MKKMGKGRGQPSDRVDRAEPADRPKVGSDASSAVWASVGIADGGGDSDPQLSLPLVFATRQE